MFMWSTRNILTFYFPIYNQQRELFSLYVIFANNKDSDEMAQNKPSHQDLHCLPFSYFILKPLFEEMHVSKFKDGSAYSRNCKVKGLIFVGRLGTV